MKKKLGRGVVMAEFEYDHNAEDELLLKHYLEK